MICLDLSDNLWYYSFWVIPKIVKSGSQSAALFFLRRSSPPILSPRVPVLAVTQVDAGSKDR